MADAKPVDCVMSSWSGWSTCSKTCGGGTEQRTRSVTTAPKNGGTKCPGEDGPATSENRGCNTKGCPVDCVMGSWGGWSTCSKSCGGGTQGRNRGVITPAKNGGKCPAKVEHRSCNTKPCPPKHVELVARPAKGPCPSGLAVTRDECFSLYAEMSRDHILH